MLHKRPVPSTSQTNSSENQQNTTKTSLYELDTDIDSDVDLDTPKDILADESIAPLPIMDDIFRNCLFYLSTSLKPLLKQECYRYIIALEG